MASLKHIVALNIKRLRLKREWTFSQMAEFTDSDISTVQKWESAIRFPRPEQLEKICLAFGVPMSSIVEDLSYQKNEIPSLNESIKIVCQELGYEVRPIKKRPAQVKAKGYDLSHVPEEILRSLVSVKRWDILKEVLEPLEEKDEKADEDVG